MNRRGFLRSFAAFAAVAVMPDTLHALTQSDKEKLIEQMESGFIYDQTFYLNGPIIIDVETLEICKCKFIFDGPGKHRAAITVESSNNIIFTNCIIDCKLNTEFIIEFKDNAVDEFRHVNLIMQL